MKRQKRIGMTPHCIATIVITMIPIASCDGLTEYKEDDASDEPDVGPVDADEVDSAVDPDIDTTGDTGMDTTGDTGIDTTSDTGIDTTSDTGSDTGSDTSSDTGLDTSIDTTGDTASDTGSDTSSDTSIEPECTSPLECDDLDDCTTDTCDSVTGTCVHAPLDGDGDGYAAETSPSGADCGGDDCDDTAFDVHPGAPEVGCDTLDANCNGAITEYVDDDLDGHDDEVCGGDDCDDTRPDVYAGAPEICLDGVDQDCDTVADGLLGSMAEIRLSDGIGDSTYAPIAWSGSEFGVAWTDDVTGDDQIYFTRVDESGVIMGSSVQVTTAAGYSGAAAIAWTGSEYGLAWGDTRDGSSNTEVYFTRMSPSGSKIGSDVRVTNASLFSGRPRLVWAGGVYGIAWADNRDGSSTDTYFVRLGGTGTKLGSDTRLSSLSGSPTDLAWSGSVYGILWHESGGLFETDLHIQSLDSTGSSITGWDIVDGPADVLGGRLTWSGSEYGLVWSDERDGDYQIFFTRADASTSKIGSDIRISDSPTWTNYGNIEWGPGEYAVAWSDTRDGNYEIYVARVSATGTKLTSDIQVTDLGFPAYSPQLSWSGSVYGLSWYDNRTGDNEVYFKILAFCE